MDTKNVIETDKEYVANTYGRFDVAFKEGKGSLLYDFEGKEYIDFGAGIAVNTFGLDDSIWVSAVTKQLSHLSHASNLYYTSPCAMLAKLLCEKTGMKKVFFGNSGAEANECAIKCARKYSSDKYGNDRYEIITLVNSFHGRTIATLAATGQDVFHKNFGPFPTGFVYAKANDIADLKSKVNEHTCAIMFETIQGEGGVVPLNDDFIEAISKIALEKDILMIVDEVQTGNGRTGYLYSYMRYGIKPNIVTTAKGLAGGLPLGAIMFDSKCEHVLSYGDHGSTFGGNPVAAAGAISILERLDDNLFKEVLEKEELIRNELSNNPNVISITGHGLMLGIEVKKPAKEVAVSCLNKGLVVLTAKTKIRLLPALNISNDLLLKGLKILEEVISE